MITTNYSINYASQIVPEVIPAVQGDTGRTLIFTPADFTIPAGCTATYYVQKPSGEAVYNTATISDGKITCALTAQALAEVGENKLQVRVLNGEDIVTSFSALLIVHPFEGIGAIESTTEINIFDQAVEDAYERITEEVVWPANFYGTCQTAAATQDKTVTVQGGFILKIGVVVNVMCAFTNSASQITLNVNNTGAKAVYYRGSKVSGDMLVANGMYTFVYANSHWNMAGLNGKLLQLDDTLTVSGKAADAKATGDRLDAVEAEAEQALEEKADKDGNYKDMTVGNAEQLVSSVFVEDSVPYLFRTSGGSADIGDREYDEIVGGTVAWNQLVNDESVTVPSGHKYYMVKAGTKSIGSSAGTAITGLTVGTDIIIDLTQMFGTTIADYIYSLEQANAGAGVAWFMKLFPKAYYPYDAGTLKSVEGVSAHVMTGFNQWDEEWEVGAYTSNDGTKVSVSDRIRSKNFIPVLPSTIYYRNKGLHVYYYDADFNYLGWSSVGTPGTFTTADNCHYITFNGLANSGTTYNHDICINLSWDGERDGEYEPYVKNSYPLDDSLTLRGIPKLDANNNLYYDGDTYQPDGTVTRKYGVVDLGTLNWTYQSENTRFLSSISLKANGYNNIICEMYAVPASSEAPDFHDKQIKGFSSSNQIAIKDTAYTDATALKNALNGVHLVYELATPTAETADPFQSPQIVDDFGTEEYVSTSIVPVGHNTKYTNNLKAKLEMSPESPNGDGDYIVRQTNGVNEYVAIGSTATIQGILDRLTALENA